MSNRDKITLKDPPPPLRCAQEVQFAHDMLVAMLTGQAPMPRLRQEQIASMHAAAHALCWVLRHEHDNAAFENTLAGIKKWLEDKGYRPERGKEAGGGHAE